MRAQIARRGGTAASIAGAAIAILALGPIDSQVAAFERYNDGCHMCHGAFDGPISPKGTVFPMGSKHEMHRNANYMNTDCNLCHTQGDQNNPYSGMSNGTDNNPGAGCTGCHGRFYEGIGNSGVGLRQHHIRHGIQDCANCHPTDPPVLPEHITPTYYGTVDTNVGDPCNQAPNFLENWSLEDTEGLDNDGDDVYDEADSDCQDAPPCPPDVTGDGIVNAADLAQLLGMWGACPGCPEDLDGDGTVNAADLAIVLGSWGACP